MEPTTYDKLATVSVKESKNSSDYLRQFAFINRAGSRKPAPSEVEFRKFTANSAICYFIVAAAGIIVQSVLGITIGGALLTAVACFNAIASIVAFIWLKQRLASYLQTHNLQFPQLYEQNIRSAVKLFLLLTACCIVLCIATVIQGAVILDQTLNGSQNFFYMGVVSFLYTGQGAGNLVLGVVGILMLAYFLKKLIDFCRSEPSFFNQSTDDSTNRPINHDKSMGSVEQLAVMDLTDYVQESPQPPSTPSYRSQYADSRSVSQSSDQTFVDLSKTYTFERPKPDRTVYAARTRTLSSIETDI